MICTRAQYPAPRHHRSITDNVLEVRHQPKQLGEHGERTSQMSA